jgi:hypothetical protein
VSVVEGISGVRGRFKSDFVGLFVVELDTCSSSDGFCVSKKKKECTYYISTENKKKFCLQFSISGSSPVIGGSLEKKCLEGVQD